MQASGKPPRQRCGGGVTWAADEKHGGEFAWTLSELQALGRPELFRPYSESATEPKEMA